MQVPESVINVKNYTAVYISLILATTLLCTFLIVYRLLSIEWAKQKFESTRTYSFGVYGNVIEIIVESAALYSAALIVYIVFLFQDEVDAGYLNSIGEIIKVSFEHPFLCKTTNT